MDRNASGFAYLKQKISSISEAKIKEGIFVGPQIRELQQDGNFQNSLNEVEAAAWNSFRKVCKIFLGSVKVENYRDIVNDLLLSYKALGCNMSLKIHFLHSHLDFFPDNLGAVSDEHGERFHQDISSMEKRYQGRISTEDEHGPGRPVESVTQENIDKIHDLVRLDRRMTVRQIEETLGIPKTTVDRIMREHLGLRKLSARWVPKLLSPDQKAVRRKLYSDNLGPSLYTRVQATIHAMKTLRFPFPQESQDSSISREGYDFLNKGQTITGKYYANLVKQLREAIKEKRRGKLSTKIVYHPDNAPSHRSLQAMATIYDSGFKLLPHAPYSPDLAPSDFDLFPHLKKSLSGINFRSDEEVIDAVTSFFESLETSFLLEGIKALEHRWKKCIDLKGYYVEG
ncbi:hypothetical protein LAZ67_5002872 [Cordylochernes scorpioides]|uniref:Histone-lysine N-methyltransferase SETMAR n=1 Tax=Cordylochernes scorpioides TaxID=51811 RepID=A0ABY6KHF8_9ARAC|nr:hypothetical protein LAZ67_5002872 [Cordylochernes scorpioides]